MSAPLSASIADLSAAYRDGRQCPIAHAEACLERIARLNPRLECFVSLADGALDQAAASRRRHREGQPLGLLDGAIVAVKDNYLTADMPTRAGTRAEGITFPRRDAAAVARLRASGAVIVGKTAIHEFAWGTVTPPVRNPWDLERVPGGSSGGSGAALAAGLCDAALGSDTGGSIRIPASLCGTVGLKATFGAIGRSGIVPHSWSLDHAGPLTRGVEDAALLFESLRGFDRDDPGSTRRGAPCDLAVLDGGVAGLTVGVCREHFFERLEPAVEAAVEDAIVSLAQAGATVREFRMPLLRYGLGAIFAIELASSTAYHDVSLRAGRCAEFQPDVRDLVEMGRLVSAADYLKAEQYRSLLIAAFREVMDEVDAVIAPTEPLTAWRRGDWTTTLGGEEESVLAASWRLTYPFNLTGQPAVTLPCGFDDKGLPIGLQIAGRPFEETTVLRVARAYEAAHDWCECHPSL